MARKPLLSLLISLCFLFGMTFAATPPPTPAELPVVATSPSVDGLTLPADMTVSTDEGFVIIEAQTKGEVRWLVLGTDTKVKFAFEGKRAFVGIPAKETTLAVYAVALVDGKLTDFARTLIFVKGGTVPNPGPAPNPNPTPNPNPVPAPMKIFMTVVVDVNTITPAQARVINDPGVKKYIDDKGHKKFLYDSKSDLLKSKGFEPIVAKVGVPSVVFQDQNGKVLDSIPLPADPAALLKAIKKAEVPGA